MSIKTIFAVAIVALTACPALAGDGVMIKDPYARSGAKSGAAFFTVMNHSDMEKRLVGARSDAANRVELHTHLEDENGVMKMREIEGGIVVPAGGMHALQRGGDHVMFMGLDAPFEQGSTINLTLIFEDGSEIAVELPVDNDRKASHSAHSGHDNH